MRWLLSCWWCPSLDAAVSVCVWIEGFGVWYFGIKSRVRLSTKQVPVERIVLRPLEHSDVIKTALYASEQIASISDHFRVELSGNQNHVHDVWNMGKQRKILRGHEPDSKFCFASANSENNYRIHEGQRELALVHYVNLKPHSDHWRPIAIKCRCFFINQLTSPILNHDPLRVGNSLKIGLPVHGPRLSLDSQQGPAGDEHVNCRDIYDDPFWSYGPWQRFLWGVFLSIAGLSLGAWSGNRWVYDKAKSAGLRGDPCRSCL